MRVSFTSKHNKIESPVSCSLIFIHYLWWWHALIFSSFVTTFQICNIIFRAHSRSRVCGDNRRHYAQYVTDCDSRVSECYGTCRMFMLPLPSSSLDQRCTGIARYFVSQHCGKKNFIKNISYFLIVCNAAQTSLWVCNFFYDDILWSVRRWADDEMRKMLCAGWQPQDWEEEKKHLI